MNNKTSQKVTNPKKRGPITGTGQDLYTRARKIIPGGTQLFSKRPELFLPDQWPAYYKKAHGVEVWDLDDRRYLDFTSCGIGTSVLGIGNPEINAAVAKAMDAGNMSTLNCPEEVELAELLIDLHPWADMVRYARTGGEILSIAVRIARAATGRDRIAFCGYHGWGDWYLAANIFDDRSLDKHLLAGLSPAGVPAGLSKTAMPFHYNKIDELRAIVKEAGPELAAIVMEPRVNSQAPEPGFLEEVRDIADSCGAVLIFDDITSGWRVNTGGIHLTLGVDPHMAVFAKTMSNGYPMSAVIGTRDVMQAAQDSFISSSYWTERIGPTAALATIRMHQRENVPEKLIHAGTLVQKGWRDAAEPAGLAIRVFGIEPLSFFAIDAEDADALTTLFTQEMLARGFLAGGHFYATIAHTDDKIESYLDATAEVFRELASAVDAGDARERLNGPVKHSTFQRLD
ncbi:MAG: aminotransferase class III-fold pyridoxal phosphate-dependent enzyme [Rhodospirillales bacterium]|nr:aminotransferase class III-fold pyridoxal phosphate-dependent enzyme [Rhodospirillales bacterium]